MSRDVKEMWVYIPLEGHTKQKSTAEFTNMEKTCEFLMTTLSLSVRMFPFP